MPSAPSCQLSCLGSKQHVPGAPLFSPEAPRLQASGQSGSAEQWLFPALDLGVRATGSRQGRAGPRHAGAWGAST